MQKDNMQQNSQLSRRGLFGAAALAGVAASLNTTLLRGETPATATRASKPIQGAGAYAFKVGSIEVAVVSDGSFPANPKAWFPKTTDEERAAAMKNAFVETDAVPTHVNTLLIRSGSEVSLIDTGCGTIFGPSVGKAVENLARLGVTPDDVTTVVITHLHGDHFGGLLASDGSLVFKNAQVVISAPEIAFWEGAADLSKSLIDKETGATFAAGAKKTIESLKKSGRLVEGVPEKDVALGVSLVAAPGHTPGHSVIQVASGDSMLLYLTDTLHSPALQLRNVDWHMVFDVDPAQAVETRKKLLDHAARNRLLIAGSHIPFPAIGHLEKISSGYALVPSVWDW